jgi:uncharacterized protein
MLRIISAFLLLATWADQAPAQQRRTFVRASGEGVVSIKPDQMKLTMSVVTQADTADKAAQDNATRTSAVISAVQKVLGLGGQVRTIAYNVTPVYRYPQGGTPVLTGYSASNTIEATTEDLSIPGRIIDAAVQAGSTNVGGLQFGLKDPQPAKAAALKLATQKALANAKAIASGLEANVGSVVSVAEASVASVPLTIDRTAAAAATPTPVETGMVEVRATVVLEADLIP